MYKIFCGVALTMCLLICGCSSGPEAAEGKAGETVKIVSSYYEQVLVFGAPGDTEPKEVAHNPSEISDMVKKGGVFPLNNGTKAKVLEWKGENKDVRKVEILDGQYKGKQGYVTVLVMKKDK